jgi:hypothetical protein
MSNAIFLSYDSQDAPFVELLSAEIKKYNLRILSINLKIDLKDDILDPRKLAQAMPGCDQVIIVASKAYTSSSWLLSESLAFFKLMDPGSSIRLALVEDCDLPFHLKSLPAADFRGIDLESLGDRKHPNHAEKMKMFGKATKELVAHINKNPQAFVIMKFGDESLDSAYKNAIAPALRESGYKPVRIDRVPVAGSITTETLQQIAKSEVVLADLTGGRPNCYYETGYAHALGKDVILSIRKRSAKHFSLRVHQFIEWDHAEGLKKQITARLERIHKQKGSLSEEGA